jgi:hypothetical protein
MTSRGLIDMPQATRNCRPKPLILGGNSDIQLGRSVSSPRAGKPELKKTMVFWFLKKPKNQKSSNFWFFFF